MDGDAQTEKGKEFYTIRTDSEKVFYLVIDRNGSNEEVYFLTEISENDLLHVTAENSQTLPQNSAVLESALPASEKGLPDGGMGEAGTDLKENELQEENASDDVQNAEKSEEDEPEQEESEEHAKEKDSPAAAYLILAVLAAGIAGGGYYLKSARAKKEAFLDEEDDEDEEEYEDDEGEDEEEYVDGGDGEYIDMEIRDMKIRKTWI